MTLLDKFFSAIDSVAVERKPSHALATVDGGYAGTGPARVRFDGETTFTTKSYQLMGCKIAASDRVVMLRMGPTWVVQGRIGDRLA